ncbi:TetR/AcrR family transcriptional regulator [Chitinimonas arctica]|uniref:TetR/AcrR family transcriptional regulator n=1 Tax=Chitinimonas arctica TaxID=2594795 RepID=A0A516SBZ8_9NEIS|nr:TetR/AcrR family transcriptional regulator [Chitinimonas arctica]QDQ25670.1 TetR/AcrR family transcriptional regulator [Chitinimonas arctica]
MTVRQFDDTREHLLATGAAIMLGKGFAAVGLTEILAAAQVPKGSFYHYFESKEAYGVALLERYFGMYLSRLDELVANTELTGRAKLDQYFAAWRCASDESDVPSRCLVVKLTGEVCDLSESMRAQLEHGIAAVIERLVVYIETGRADRSIPAGPPADVLARSVYQLWLGSALLTKVQNNTEAFDFAQAATERMLHA